MTSGFKSDVGSAQTTRFNSYGFTLALVLVGSALTSVALLTWSDVPFNQSLRISLLIGINVCASGSIWVNIKRQGISASEFIGVGIIGTFLFSLILILTLPIQMASVLLWVLGPAIALALFLITGKQNQYIRRITFDRLSFFSGVFAIFVSLVLNRYQIARYQFTDLLNSNEFHPDTFFHQSVVNAIRETGAGQLGLMSDWSIRYHWFSHGIASAFETSAALDPLTALTRVLPFLSIFAIAFLASAWAHQLTKAIWVPVVAATTLTSGKFVGDASGVQINWDSISQTVSTAVFLFACFLVYNLITNQTNRILVPFIALFSFTLIGLKFSSGIVFLCVLFAVSLLGLITKASWMSPIVWTLALSILTSIAAFLIYIAGQNDSGALEVRSGIPEIGAIIYDPALVTTLALLPGWLGLLYLLFRRIRNWTALTAIGVGAAVGGLLPLWVLQYTMPNSVWFITTATSVVWLISIYAGGQITGNSFAPNGGYGNILALTGFITALFSVLVWGWLDQKFQLPGVISQLSYLLLLSIVGFAFSVLLILRNQQRPWSFVIVIIVVAGVSSPVAINASIRLFSNTSQMEPSVVMDVNSGDEATSDSRELTPQILVPEDLQLINESLKDYIQNGDVVAFSNDALMPLIVQSRAIPYAIGPNLSIGLGPRGTGLEFERRTALIDAAMNSSSSSSSVETMCSEGVSWLLAPSDLALAADEGSKLDLLKSVGGIDLLSLECL